RIAQVQRALQSVFQIPDRESLYKQLSLTRCGSQWMALPLVMNPAMRGRTQPVMRHCVLSAHFRIAPKDMPSSRISIQSHWDLTAVPLGRATITAFTILLERASLFMAAEAAVTIFMTFLRVQAAVPLRSWVGMVKSQRNFCMLKIEGK